MKRPVLALLLCSIAAGGAHAQSSSLASERLIQLARVPGVSGYEGDVRKAVAAMLPPSMKPGTDNLGNLFIRLGSGTPKTLIVAPLDEPGYIVSGITDDGYLRLNRHTNGLSHPLAHEYHVGQPVLIRTASGSYANGVTATPSTHLRATRPGGTDTVIRTMDDLFVDVGATSKADVTALGIRMLDAVTLRDRVARLAGSEVAGVATSARAGAVALLEIVNRIDPATIQGAVTIAWTAQSFFGQRGLARLIEIEKPDRVIAFTGSVAPSKDETGTAGAMNGGPIVRDDETLLVSTADTANLKTQKRPRADLPLTVPRGLENHVVAIPARYAQTPAEVVDARDIERAAQMVAAASGLGRLKALTPIPRVAPPPSMFFSEPDLRLLAGFVRAYGVSTHEEAVRAELLRRLPAWAKPETDKKGNVIVKFGSGGKPLMFVAHLDEVGFEITALNDDGTAAIKLLGGAYLSLYEAHPVLVHGKAGDIEGVIAPRRNYPTASILEPELSALVLDIGVHTKADALAAGLEAGQSITQRKDLVKLGANRASARGMDDRNGSTALLMALSRVVDPKLVKNTVTFVWSVEEETGLAGAAFVATTESEDTVFAIDTFVSSDTPVDSHRVANLPLGAGAVLRGLDSRTIVTPDVIDRIVTLAKGAAIPLQIGITGGGTDATPFSAKGSIDVGLSWPGRYSHSPVEVMDRRDLESLTRLIVTLVQKY